ncbi:hypothetical protein ACFE04_004705 [Oxalis oulophora]
MRLSPQQEGVYNKLLHFTQQKSIVDGRALHAQIIKTQTLSSCILIVNNLIILYAKCGHLTKAKLVFEHIPIKDVVSWNSIINSYTQQGGSSFSLDLFRRMRAENMIPNGHTLAGVLTAASNLNQVFSGRQAHALAMKFGSVNDVYVGSSLVNMFCKVGLVKEGRKVFDEMPERNSYSWATMISGYAMERMARESFELFRILPRDEEGWEYDFVMTSVLSSLVEHELVDSGRQLHCLSVKAGLLSFVSVWNALVTMYMKCGSLDDALRTFELSDDKNSITWSAMITGYAQCGDFLKALKLFSDMHFAEMKPSEFTFVGALNACSDTGAILEGKQIHAYLLKLGFEFQIFIMTNLVDMYAKCGCTADARKGFDFLQEPDIVLWTSMISGYVQNGENEEALNLYARMQMLGILPNELTMASVLKACSSLASLEQGKQIHARSIKHGFSLEAPMGTALSTMYTKCGSLEDGEFVFRRMPARDILSWNAMISGLWQNDHGTKALELFEEMLKGNTKPDCVTFVNILSACSHTGMVERGWDYFNTMSHRFGINPRLEHYSCMVDILSRAGKLAECKEFIESTKIEHGMCLWRTLLSACRNQRDYKLGAYAGEKLMELGSLDSSAYVQLSNIYTALGKPEDVQRVRRMMKLREVSKAPGCSWIELKSGVHAFVVGDQMHPKVGKIRTELKSLTKQMKDEGYIPTPDHGYGFRTFCVEDVVAECL